MSLKDGIGYGVIASHGKGLAAGADEIGEGLPDVSACLFDVVDRHVDVTYVGHLKTVKRTGAC